MTTDQNYRGIELTERAAEMAIKLAAENSEYSGKVLRLYLDGKGCDGFFYGVSFDQPSPQDLKFSSNNTVIVVDSDSIEFVDGSNIDWVDDERGRGFLVENPNHRKFRGKFYKRSNWQTKLEEKLRQRSAPGT
jgi:iron-sulfur cluster insertion protein